MVDIVPLVPGIVFDTYVGGGLYCEEKEGVLLLIDGYRFRYLGVYGEFPLVCRVSFSIPVRAADIPLGVQGIVFDTQEGCGRPLGVQGIVFNTRESCGYLPWCAGYDFSYPRERWALLRGAMLLLDCRVSFSIPRSVWGVSIGVLGIVFDTYEDGEVFLRGGYSSTCAGYRFRYP